MVFKHLSFARIRSVCVLRRPTVNAVKIFVETGVSGVHGQRVPQPAGKGRSATAKGCVDVSTDLSVKVADVVK